jgi:hypothetical protein
MTKGRDWTKIFKIPLGERLSWGEIDKIGHGHKQRGSNIEEYKGIKILGQEKHTSRWSKLMNFD